MLDVPDSKANARVFGYPGSRQGTKAGLPKVRLVMLVEAGTHLIVDAIIVSVSDRRASPREKIAALSWARDATDVGQRTAFLCNG